MADWILMPFGVVGRLGPRMRQVVEVGDYTTAMGNFWDGWQASHCNLWGLCGTLVWKCMN